MKAQLEPENEDIFRAIIKALEQELALDKIRAEINAESAKSFRYPNWERAKALEWALSIIDKYKPEIEPQESEE